MTGAGFCNGLPASGGDDSFYGVISPSMTATVNPIEEALFNLPTGELRRLAEWRKVPVSGLQGARTKRQAAAKLAFYLSRPETIFSAYIRCSVRERRLMSVLSMLDTGPHAVDISLIVETAGGERVRETVLAALNSLQKKGLAFIVENRAVFPEWAHEVWGSISRSFTLRRCLGGYDSTDLGRVCESLGLSVAERSRSAIVEQVAQYLTSLATSGRIYDILDEDAAGALSLLVAVQGAMDPAEVVAEVDPDNFEEKDFSGYAWLNRWKQGNESNPVDRLLSRGIAYLVWQHYGMEQLLVVPGDLLSLLLSYEDQSVWEKDAPALERETINEVAELVAPAIAVDVTRLLAYVEANEVPRTNSGIIHKSALKNAARSFSGNEDRYATFVYSVSVAAELMQPVEGLYRVTERGREWLRANHHVQLAALYLGWLYSAQWSELFPEPLAVDRLYRPAEAVIELRAAVLDLIRSFPSDTRFKLSSFLKTADFYLPSVPNAIKNLCHEEIVSKELFLSERFLSCLHLLRIVSISVADLKPAPQLEGGSASSEPQPLEWDQISFSVTGMGKLFLTGEGESPLPEREQSFVLQANGEIYLSPYLDTAVLFTVLTISDSSDKANASSLVQVTAQSIRRALDRGTTPEEILTFLKERSRTGVPQNLEYLILDLSARHGHLRIGAGSFYLVADSPHLLKEIASRKDLKGFITRNLTENVVLIKADSEDAALKRLRKAGYLPVAESKPASKSRGSSRQLVGLPDPRSIAMADGASSRKYDSIPWKEFEQEDARR